MYKSIVLKILNQHLLCMCLIVYLKMSLIVCIKHNLSEMMLSILIEIQTCAFVNAAHFVGAKYCNNGLAFVFVSQNIRVNKQQANIFKLHIIMCDKCNRIWHVKAPAVTWRVFTFHPKKRYQRH